MSLKDFQLLQKLGEGAYSTVYKVKRLIDNHEYAMKKVKMDYITEKQKQNALNQVRVLASLNHPNIISYKEAFIEKGSNFLYIIMEYADDGDLLVKIKNHVKNQTVFPQKQVWSIFIQVTQGLKVLHDLKILHRDIKSANVFLFKNGMVKLGDLNVSKLTKSLCQTQTGTPYYASPEIWKQQPYDKKSDIWSLGCVFYQILSLKPPFRANDMEGLYKKVVRGFYSRIPPQYSNDLSVILKMLLQVTPHMRSSCDKILQHPIILKHMDYLPQSYHHSSVGNGQLLRTIKIVDSKQNTGDLARKVQLPKSRYFHTIDTSNLKPNYSNNSNIDLDGNQRRQKNDSREKHQFLKKIDKSESQKAQKPILLNENKQKANHRPSHQLLIKKPSYSQRKNNLNLPKIGKSIDLLDLSNLGIELNSLKKSQIRKIELNKSVDNKVEKKSNSIQKNVEIIQKRRNSQSQKSAPIDKSQKLLQGRLKQISQQVLYKILKQQKQRSKIHSIIGTK